MAGQNRRKIRGMKNNQIQVTGEFSMQVWRNGVLAEQYAARNLVVNGGKQILATLLANSDPDSVVTKIGFGTNGAAPVPTDAGLTGAYVKMINTYTNPAFNTVAFEWSLENNEGNGMAISEYGLLSDDSNLFARKTRDVVVKDASVRLTGIWRITFN